MIGDVIEILSRNICRYAEELSQQGSDREVGCVIACFLSNSVVITPSSVEYRSIRILFLKSVFCNSLY
jgi:hypothetical protein